MSSFTFKRFHIVSAVLYKNKNTAFHLFIINSILGARKIVQWSTTCLACTELWVLSQKYKLLKIKKKTKVYFWQIYSHASAYILSLNLFDIFYFNYGILLSCFSIVSCSNQVSFSMQISNKFFIRLL